MCDAQHIGSIDGTAPERAHQDIPPSVVRFVWRRDGGRCRIPGCRSARGLELHHLIHRADGGSHDASNIVLACSSCHQSHHAGTLEISGTAEHLEVHRPEHRVALVGDARDLSINTSSIANAGAHVGAANERTSNADASEPRSSRLDDAILHTQAKAALTALGWKPAVAHAAVTAAAAALGAELKLERLIFESLRRCPAPRA